MECSESERLFNNGLETGLELGQKTTRFLSWFLDYDVIFKQIKAAQSLHQHDLNQYLILFAPFTSKSVSYW